MQPKTDAQLLKEYAEEGSESAFTEIARRYTNLVYSAALRQVGSPDLARDVGQSVFTDLARKAKGISRKMTEDGSLVGWLYSGTRFAALTLRRGEQRRQSREREAMEQIIPAVIETAPDWEQIRPLLDQAMEEMDERDREALLLRYFRNEDLRAVGKALGVSDDAAQKRVSRAVERLREIFSKRGVTAGGVGIAAVVSANAVQAAPAGLAAAFAGGAFGAATGTTLGIWKFMTLTKVKMSMVAVVLAAGVTTAVVIQQQAQARTRAQDELARQQSEQLAKSRAENDRLSKLAGNSNANTLENLNRLRGEVAGLRGETNALANNNQKLRASNLKTINEAKSPLETSEDAKATAIGKLNYVKQWCLVMHMYAADNNGQAFTNFSDGMTYINTNSMGTNVTTDMFELTYGGKLESIKDTANTIVIREKAAWQAPGGNWMKSYGFADGHAEIHSESDGNFDAFETKHGILPASQ